MIEVKQWVKPDVSIILEKHTSYSDEKFNRHSILIERQIMIIHSCNEEGHIPNHRHDGDYYGLRMIGDKIEVCIKNFGWIPVYEEIQTKYNEQIAEQVLLGGE